MSDKNGQKTKPITFYRYFKPIAVIGRLAGVLPLKNLHSNDCKNLEFSFCSLPVLYTTLLFVSLMALMVYSTDWSFTSLPSAVTNSSIIWLFTMEALTSMYSLISWFFCTWNAKKFVKLIRLLDFYDKQRSTIFPMESDTKLVKLWRYTVKPIFLGFSFLILMILGLVAFCKFVIEITCFDSFQKLSYIFFGALGIWQVVPILYYLYFALTIAENFKHINTQCQKLIPNTKWYVNPDANVAPTNIRNTVKYIRYLHVLMADAVKYLSLAYGSFLAIGQLYTILTFALGFYLAFFTKLNGQQLFFYVSVYSILTGIVVLVSHKTRNEANKIAELMQKLPVASLDMDSKLEIQMLLSQIFATPIHISAAGYFKMDREQIPSIMSSIATYLIVLIQFSPQIWPEIEDNNSTNTKTI